MAKAPLKEPFRCSECGWSTSKWVGRCGECQAWGSIDEGTRKLNVVAAGAVTATARPIGEVDLAAAQSRSSGVAELDRTLGGGLAVSYTHLRAHET